MHGGHIALKHGATTTETYVYHLIHSPASVFVSSLERFILLMDQI